MTRHNDSITTDPVSFSGTSCDAGGEVSWNLVYVFWSRISLPSTGLNSAEEAEERVSQFHTLTTGCVRIVSVTIGAAAAPCRMTGCERSFRLPVRILSNMDITLKTFETIPSLVRGCSNICFWLSEGFLDYLNVAEIQSCFEWKRH